MLQGKSLPMIWAAGLMLVLAAGTKAENSGMLYTECRYLSPSITAGDVAGRPVKVWRLGELYMRVEEQPDPENLKHSIMISSQPHTWLVNNIAKEATHLVDTAAPYDIVLPVFKEASAEISKLQIGREVEFFKSHQARQLPDVEIDSVLCEVSETKIDGTRLTLYLTKGNRRPFQVTLANDQGTRSLRYDVYQNKLRPDLSMFMLPDNVTIIREGISQEGRGGN